MPANLENSAVATELEMSVFIPIPKKGNAKECSNYRTIALISHASDSDGKASVCNAGDAGLIPGSSAFPKTSLNIWNFTVHILLKPGLENFEHYFTSM